jgi:P27 family predicted phage terminase small subunit
VVSPPTDLSQQAQKSWHDLVQGLCEVHDVEQPSEPDLIVLADVLRAQDELDAIRQVIAAEGNMVAGSQGQVRPHPLLAVQRALRADVARGLERLWLTPRHRAAARLVRQANELTRQQR